ncbi:GDSL esterase/lipase At4g10955-like [Cornus florida]|uniref:GDSL esterase/lipase At4g10955-like n=1 Tax=Cornus florida TaxID=4283 RepID=UPI00289D73B0|nr:GDSL esterase/lipase At4g10955-like [Cornus florida]
MVLSLLYVPDSFIFVCRNDRDYRRCVAAWLVEGVYIQENDGQQNRQGTPPWWESFGFQLIRRLVDVDSIFGAIYEIKPSASHFLGVAPKYVIAFRGTIIKPCTRREDLKSNFDIFRNKLQENSRFQIAMDVVLNMVDMAGDANNIWLAGHSLGSAMALLVGKNMFKMGYDIETYLFNSPFISLPIEQLFENDKAKNVLRFAKGVVTAVVAVTLKDPQQRRQDYENFVELSKWVPNLFVNRSDPICSEYIGYFQNRRNMVKFGAERMGILATQNSISGRESELLLPSAFLTQNLSPSENFIQAHGIRQWWNPFLRSHSELHIFKFN